MKTLLILIDVLVVGIIIGFIIGYIKGSNDNSVNHLDIKNNMHFKL